MSINTSLPADNEYLSAAPAEIRENIRALKDDKIVNAAKLVDLIPGNANGNISINNGTVNTNSNADMLDGQHGSYYSPTTHTHTVATTSSSGLMSNTDKTKLDGVATGAEVNQFAFSNVLVGSTTIQADTKLDTLTMAAGFGVTLTPDAVNDAVTIAIANDGTNASHIHAVGTTGSAGFISTADKTKLDGIAVGAEVNQFAFSNVVAGGATMVADTKSDTLTINAGSGVTIIGDAVNDALTIAVTANGHTHSDATINASGFMSTVDKTKLNGIATGAEVNQFAFSNVLVGSTTVAADNATDVLTLIAGTNIALTPDATNDAVTIGVTGTVASATTAGTCTGNAATATKLATARAISLTGDATASISFDGSTAASGALTLTSSGATAGTYKSVTVDEKGRVTGGTNPTTLEEYGIRDALSSTGNAVSATKLATARKIAGVVFDGTADIAIPYTGLTGIPTPPAVSGRQLFINSGTFTVPTGVTSVIVSLVGGGGGGGGKYSTTGNGYGGGSGAMAFGVYLNVTSGQQIAITVGAGGTGGGTSAGASGGAGGASSFGTYISCSGGSGGSNSGYLNKGAGGEYPLYNYPGFYRAGANSWYPYADSYTAGNAGGLSFDRLNTDISGLSATIYGGGGNGNSTNNGRGGAGMQGYVLVQW